MTHPEPVQERIYFDGACGLCHHVVRFVLARDREGGAFRFAPLQGETCARELGPDVLARLPDSVVVRTNDGRVLTRSTAVVHVLRRLGGAAAVLGTVLACLPRPLRDAGYSVVARVRKRVFSKPPDACPAVPAELARRFDP